MGGSCYQESSQAGLYEAIPLAAQKRKKKHYRKLATKETKEPGLASAGGWVGEAFG